MLALIPQFAFAQASPFLTGANALQTNILAWLTPLAIILIMVLGGMAMANRIADTLVKRCTADAQDARRLRDLESQVRERFNCRGHARRQLDTNGLIKARIARDVDNARRSVRQPAPA
jgi:uncharacterized protein YacL